MHDRPTLLNILNQLENWMEGEAFRGWDPHDALNSPLLKRLAVNRALGILLLQTVKCSPVNLRRLLGVPKGINPKALGLMLSAYAVRFQSTGDPTDRAKIDRCAAELLASPLPRSPASSLPRLAWGYNFDWPNRAFYAPKGTPTIVTTAFIGLGFLDAYRATGASAFLDVAESAARFMLHDLKVTQHAEGTSSSYTPLDNSIIYNANMLSAAFLAEVGSLTGAVAYTEAAESRTAFALSRQRADGSWPYGEAWNQRWVDSFHTGYSLLALHSMASLTGDKRYTSALERGYAFYLDHFFLSDGRVKYEAHRAAAGHRVGDRPPACAYPFDAHAFACAMICLKRLREFDRRSDSTLAKVVRSTLDLFWSGEGYFYAKRGRIFTDKTPYMRWVQAWVFRALVELLF